MTSEENMRFNSYIKELSTKGLIYKGHYSSPKELPKYLKAGHVIIIKDKEYICTAPNHLEPLL